MSSKKFPTERRMSEVERLSEQYEASLARTADRTPITGHRQIIRLAHTFDDGFYPPDPGSSNGDHVLPIIFDDISFAASPGPALPTFTPQSAQRMQFALCTLWYPPDTPILVARQDRRWFEVQSQGGQDQQRILWYLAELKSPIVLRDQPVTVQNPVPKPWGLFQIPWFLGATTGMEWANGDPWDWSDPANGQAEWADDGTGEFDVDNPFFENTGSPGDKVLLTWKGETELPLLVQTYPPSGTSVGVSWARVDGSNIGDHVEKNAQCVWSATLDTPLTGGCSPTFTSGASIWLMDMTETTACEPPNWLQEGDLYECWKILDTFDGDGAGDDRPLYGFKRNEWRTRNAWSRTFVNQTGTEITSLDEFNPNWLEPNGEGSNSDGMMDWILAGDGVTSLRIQQDLETLIDVQAAIVVNLGASEQFHAAVQLYSSLDNITFAPAGGRMDMQGEGQAERLSASSLAHWNSGTALRYWRLGAWKISGSVVLFDTASLKSTLIYPRQSP